MQLELGDEEGTLLREVLDAATRDLSSEIADTDNSRFRDELRGRRELLVAILGRLGGPLADAEG